MVLTVDSSVASAVVSELKKEIGAKQVQAVNLIG
jgi:hypothetical protein